MVTTFWSCKKGIKFFKWLPKAHWKIIKIKYSEDLFTWAQLYPSITSWWALAMSFKLFVWLNCSEISCSNQVTRMFYSKMRMNDTSIFSFATSESSYLAKSISSTPRWYAPTTTIIRVGPQKITHGSLVGNFLHTIKIPYVIQIFNWRRQTTMQAKYFRLNLENSKITNLV